MTDVCHHFYCIALKSNASVSKPELGLRVVFGIDVEADVCGAPLQLSTFLMWHLVKTNLIMALAHQSDHRRRSGECREFYPGNLEVDRRGSRRQSTRGWSS